MTAPYYAASSNIGKVVRASNPPSNTAVMSYTFAVSFGNWEIIIIISDSLSPTTECSVSNSSVRLYQLQSHLLCRCSSPQSGEISAFLSPFDIDDQRTTGALNLLISCANRFIASGPSLAPSTIWPAFRSPVYSMIDLSWSPVGGSSVTFSWNSVR